MVIAHLSLGFASLLVTATDADSVEELNLLSLQNRQTRKLEDSIEPTVSCQELSNEYDIHGGVTWGSATAEAIDSWHANVCNTKPFCQELSNKYGIDYGVWWGSATAEAKKSWHASNCKTKPSPDSCQELSNKYGIDAGDTWGSATAEAKESWVASNCQTKPCPCSCQELSNEYDIHGGVTWGSATAEAKKSWDANDCKTKPLTTTQTTTPTTTSTTPPTTPTTSGYTDAPVTTTSGYTDAPVTTTGPEAEWAEYATGEKCMGQSFDISVAASQYACEQHAILAKHSFYQYHARQGFCATVEACFTPTPSAGYMVYRNPALWPLNAQGQKCSNKKKHKRDGVESQLGCQQKAMAEGKSYYAWNAHKNGCIVTNKCKNSPAGARWVSYKSDQ